MRQRLFLLSLLIGFDQQLDVMMTSEGRIVGFMKKLDTLLEVTRYEH